MSGSKRSRPLQRREFLRLSSGAMFLTAAGGVLGGSLAGCTGGRNDAFSNLPSSGSSPGPGQQQQTRVLVAQDQLRVGTQNGQTVAHVVTLQNVQGRNYHVFGVENADALPQRIVQTIAWQNDPSQYTRTIFDSQSRPAQVVYAPTGHFATLNWNADNTAVTLRAYDNNSTSTLLGGATVRRQGDNYVVEPLASGTAAAARHISSPAAPLASVSADKVSRFVASAFGLDVLGALVALTNPYVALLAALVLLLTQGTLSALLAPSTPTIAALLVTNLILSLFFPEAFTIARERLRGGSAIAGVIAAASSLFLPHVFNAGTGFYTTD